MRAALHASGRSIFCSIDPNTSGTPGLRSDYDSPGIADMVRNTIALIPLWRSQFGEAGLLTNPDIIAVDQDRLVAQGHPSPRTTASWSSRWPPAWSPS